MRRLLREPLFHFLVLGAALFALFGAINGRSSNRENHITVSAGQIAHLAMGFTRTWRRPPTADELNGLIRGYVREEVFYREAKAMGLDRDDPIIRRRLQQKLEFLSEDTAAETEPSDEDLGALLRSRPDKFHLGGSVTFSHIYLNPERHPDNVNETAAKLLMELNNEGAAAVDASAQGDRFLLGNTFESTPVGEVAKLFGANFAERLGGLNIGGWQGPIKSGYGVHLVFVQERKEGRIPTPNEAREALRHEWKEMQRNKANEDVFQKLLSRYVVTLEGSQTAAPLAKETGGAQR